MQITDRIVVVTGGASGIGRALCEAFARAGAAGVGVADRDAAGAAAVAQAIGAHALALEVDVADETSVQQMVARATERFGRVDVLCSNAGIMVRKGLDATAEEWRRIVDINVMAHVYAARAVLPQMLARGEGYLVNTASAAGLLSQVDSAPYSVTKHAAVALAEWLSITYGDRGIRVSCLCPQGVRTPMLLGLSGQRESFLNAGALTPEAVADEVLRAMADERFLILPHPEVREYLRRKTEDPERWLRGMRRLSAQVAANDPF